jgi:hypothetical protein
MKTTKDDFVAEAIKFTLTTPNESDSNGESANVVDGLFAIARALRRVAVAIERLEPIDPVHGPREDQEDR